MAPPRRGGSGVLRSHVLSALGPGSRAGAPPPGGRRGGPDGSRPRPGRQRKTLSESSQLDDSSTTGVRPGRVREWYIASISSA
ncbi:hypothetical protein B7767_21425 [Streptomyces sp. 13-12-16]|nr:hypothetical protein B7767_21425 [Streptomyces sp. 13-12-16]